MRYENSKIYSDPKSTICCEPGAWILKHSLQPLHKINSQSMHYTWGQYESKSFKRVIVRGKVNRAIKCSTDSTIQNKSLYLIKELFITNGYANSFIKSVIRSMIHKNKQQNNQHYDEPNEKELQKFTYIKL